MRKFIPLIAFCSFSLMSNAKVVDNIHRADTTHEVDGDIKEWSDSLFIKDASTNISYAIANTNTHLFVALKCTDPRMQLKLMRLGMQMYIDVKGKHREGMGVGFPIKNENGTPQGGGFGGDGGRNRNQDEQQDGQGRSKPDFKAMRQMFGMNMFSLSLFGFDGIEEKKQGLAVDGSVNIAFSWDDKDVMYVEYSVPLSYINSNVSSLKGKSFAIGWKINGRETQSSNSSTTRTELVAVPGGRGGNGGRGTTSTPINTTNSSSTGSNFDSAMKEQSFWGKYDIKL